MNNILDTWLREAIEFYKPLGFFTLHRGETPAVAQALQKTLTEASTDPITHDDLLTPEFDLYFLSFDPLRSLYSAMEFGDYLAPGNDAYVSSLEALAKISRGVFRPRKISESWDTPDGPIRIKFELSGQPKELKVETWGGMFDFRILLQLNHILAKTEYRFEMAPMDDILFVTVLTSEEKSKLERERDLAFMVLNLPRTFYPLHHLGQPLPFPDDPEEPIFYVGTLNENLDRCIGRLRFIVRDDKIEGHHQYLGISHTEDFTFNGTLDKETLQAKGRLKGHINVKGEMIAYEGVWSGNWCKGNRVATGTWDGWFCRDREKDREKPSDESKIYSGQWGLLEEDFSRSHHHYVARVRAWLELVWQSRSSDDYPWLLTQGE